MGLCASAGVKSSNDEPSPVKRMTRRPSRRSSSGSLFGSGRSGGGPTQQDSPPPPPPPPDNYLPTDPDDGGGDGGDGDGGSDDHGEFEFEFLMEAEEDMRKQEETLHIGIHCDDCGVCPIKGPVQVYANDRLTTLCKKCVSGDKVPLNKQSTQCFTLEETLLCLLRFSGLLSSRNKLSEKNFKDFWKLKYQDMPDYQLDALVAGLNIEEGVNEFHSNKFLELWLSLSSDESSVVKNVTHRQLECCQHERCVQPFGAAPILGWSYVSLDNEGTLECYCDKCFRAVEPMSSAAGRKFERCRTEQESMSAAFRMCGAKGTKSLEEWVESTKNGFDHISLVAFGQMYGYGEKMTEEEQNSMCDIMHMRPGTRRMNFLESCIGSLILAGAHETPTLEYSILIDDSHLVEIGLFGKNSTIGGSTATNSKEVAADKPGVLPQLTSQQIDGLFMTVMSEAKLLLSADRATFFLIDDTKEQLWSRVATGSDPIRIPKSAGVVGRCISTNQALRIGDAYTCEFFNQDVDKRTGYKTTSVLASPIRDDDTGDVIGALEVINKDIEKDDGLFTENDEEMLGSFCDHISIAIDECNKIQTRKLEMAESIKKQKTMGDEMRKKFDEERLQQKKREMKVEEKMIQVRKKFEQQRTVENAKEKLQMEALSGYEKRRAIRQSKGYHTSVSLQEKGGKEDAEELAARIFEGTDTHSTSCSGSSDLEEV